MKMKKILTVITAFAILFIGAMSYPVLTVNAEETQQATATTTMYATANVNVRTGDSTSSQKLGALTKNQAVAVSGKTEKGWYIIDYNGQTGYVSAKYLTDGTPVQSATNTTPAFQAASTEKTNGGITLVPNGFTPSGLQIWCLKGDTGTWDDSLITAYDSTGITSDMSDYDKAVAINNYICKVVEYDHDFANGVVNYRPASEIGRYCIISGRGICQDYAEAFDTLCTIAGVCGNWVWGPADNGQEIVSHAWNYVVIDETKYWVDVCWNDIRPNEYLMSTTPFADHTYEGENE